MKDVFAIKNIKGFIPTSLVDWDGKVSAVLFLSGCNFRCPFCLNKDLVLPNKELKAFSFEKIKEYLEKNKGFIDGIVITGGEPCLNDDLKELCRELRKMDFKIKLDTNGSNPELLKQLIKENLIDYIAMDIKSDKENYDKTSGVKVDLKKIEESMKIIINSGIDYEFRTTLVPTLHNQKVVENIAKWLKEISNSKIKKFVLQKFQVKDDLLDKEFEKLKSFKDEEMQEFKEIAERFVKTVLR